MRRSLIASRAPLILLKLEPWPTIIPSGQSPPMTRALSRPICRSRASRWSSRAPPNRNRRSTSCCAISRTPHRRSFTTGSRQTEIGERFGLSDNDIAMLTGWLQSQGLQVSWVAPSRTFIGFTGTAANVGRAFQTELHYYTVQRQAAHVGFIRSHDSRGTRAGHQFYPWAFLHR